MKTALDKASHLVRQGELLVARPTASESKLPRIDVARLIEKERSRQSRRSLPRVPNEKAGRSRGNKLRPQYKPTDFSTLIRGKYAKRVSQATSVVVLKPKVARESPPPPPPSSPLRSSPAATFARLRLLDRLQVLRRQLALARRGARYPEVFHQLRVAVRRFRVAEAIVTARAPSPGFPALGKDLRRVAQRGGCIRDEDVMAMALRERAKSRKTLAPVAISLVQRLAERRVRRLGRLDRALVEWAPQGRCGRAMATLNFALRRELAVSKTASRKAIILRPADVGPILSPVSRTFLARSGAPLVGAVRLPSMHALRIAGKHLRYALEFVEPGLPPALLRHAHRVLKRLVRLQKSLGDIQDRRVRLEWIVRRAAKAAGRGAMEAIPLQRLEEVERRDLRTVIVRCGSSWRRGLPVVRRHLAEMKRARIR